jgi:hypothetical protein
MLLGRRFPDLHRRKRLAEPSDDGPMRSPPHPGTVRFVDFSTDTGKMGA